ncbi:MAG TPA: 5-oxoprolinase/urea amidolyase family protein, partial [Ktedonobacterales bacterium]
YFLGFLAGFPYLGGLPASLAVSRLPTPRAHVVAGSVGIAGHQTGIYPVASPGGWRLIGRTPWPLFDPTADPPTLLHPGDRVRFASLPEGSGPALRTPRKPFGATQAAPARRVVALADPPVPWLRVLRPGPLTTVQDLGRPGYARYGVSASGAADGDALRLGNALLSNPAGAAALEVTLGGVAVEALAPSALAVTGADCEIRVNGRVVPLNRVQLLAPGDGIELSVAQRGVRAYLCVAGGVAVPPLLGSRSTDVRAGLGGLDGRALRSGDLVQRDMADGASAALAGRALRGDPERRLPLDGEWRLRVTPGHHHATAPALLDRLLAARFTVDPRSDRVGVRLRWSERADAGEGAGGELLSEGVPRGAVQVPPDGEPIILLADHQTTGGYAVPAVVITADLWRVGQLRPGDSVRLVLVAPDAAVAALAEREAWLHAVAERWATGERVVSAEPGEVDAARLMGGFSEWSEEAGDDE